MPGNEEEIQHGDSWWPVRGEKNFKGQDTEVTGQANITAASSQSCPLGI